MWNLRPRSKGGKWKHNDAEDADAAEFAVGGDMPTVSPEGIEPRRKLLVNQPAGGVGGSGVVKYEVSCTWKFQSKRGFS